jgi:2-oxoglutarate dehydrogenase E1 component
LLHLSEMLTTVNKDFTFIGNAEPAAIDQLYQAYLNNPESVDPQWQLFFRGFEFKKEDFKSNGTYDENTLKEFRVINLINAYRTRGHLFTLTNPVRTRRKYLPTLDIENFGLDSGDLQKEFSAGEEIGIGKASLSNIIAHLKEKYCQSIGTEYIYIRKPEMVKWMQDKIEKEKPYEYTPEQKIAILKELTEASIFEQYIQKKFVGQKRFSIEGGESLMSALHTLVDQGVDLGIEQFVIGMAHRGRINTLAHILDKPYADIFNEFEGKDYDDEGVFDGDVKYHLGYSKYITTPRNKEAHITLCPNPSHLEAVSPIVEGLARAKIDQQLDDEKKILPILVHGDAAIAGQGIAYEVVQMSQLKGYRTGGSIHIVVNNQVGFTTNYLDARSSTYCTDVAKTTLSPVFHVNSDDVEAVITTIRWALEFRQTFSRDVFIDLLGYRKYGHNEGDEPKFTQPRLYDIIAKHPNTKTIYQEKLKEEGIIDDTLGKKKIENEVTERLDEAFEQAKDQSKAVIKHFLEITWKGYRKATKKDFEQSPSTAYKRERLIELAEKSCELPEGFHFFRKIKKLMKERLNALHNDTIDWGLAENLAYASILDEGRNVRLTGQDVERGTFSHRHAVLVDEKTEETYVPLNHLSENQGEFYIYNSLLSEYGVLGFEYGYALAHPHGLNIWEAQFGDFFNGAQIIIDQFITAAEDKWRLMNGIVLLLPHGYEGMGSEHSSARMERFLMQCAELNMQVCNCTTPANFFHLLRRQVKFPFRKPLVLFTPKRLLRYPKAVSTLDELANGRFHEVLDDTIPKPENVSHVVLCSGKLYYELLEEREKRGLEDTFALIRLEQLYPFPEKQLNEVLKRYKNTKGTYWIQEEPENMGAWRYLVIQAPQLKLQLIAKGPSASPAPGSPLLFEQRQKAIIDRVFELSKTN